MPSQAGRGLRRSEDEVAAAQVVDVKVAQGDLSAVEGDMHVIAILGYLKVTKGVRSILDLYVVQAILEVTDDVSPVIPVEDEDIPAFVAAKEIVAVTSFQNIPAVASAQPIVVSVTPEVVGTSPSLKHVFALAAADCVISGEAAQYISIFRTTDAVVAFEYLFYQFEL